MDFDNFEQAYGKELPPWLDLNQDGIILKIGPQKLPPAEKSSTGAVEKMARHGSELLKK